jgi:hypothetical protein
MAKLTKETQLKILSVLARESFADISVRLNNRNVVYFACKGKSFAITNRRTVLLMNRPEGEPTISLYELDDYADKELAKLANAIYAKAFRVATDQWIIEDLGPDFFSSKCGRSCPIDDREDLTNL